MSVRRAVMAATVVTTGLSAGFFVTYAISVTRGLSLVDDATYVQAMQDINATVRTGWFAAFFFGAAPLLVLAAFVAATVAARATLAVATVLYVGGVLGVTFLANVPLNDDLAERTDTSAAALAGARAAFESEWNDWNLVRTLAALAVFVAVAIIAVTSSGSCRRDAGQPGSAGDQHRDSPAGGE